MDWSDLRIFLAIARTGTLGAAARSLGISQPTMGRRLRALEAAMGQTLVQRTADGLVLTDEGALVLAHAERMEHEAESITRRLMGREPGLSGQLRISCSDWFGSHVLGPILSRFTRDYPNVLIELVTDARLVSLSRREADIAFRIRPFEEPDVISRKLVTIPYGVFAAEGFEMPDGIGSAEIRKITMDEAFGAMPDVAWLDAAFPDARTSFRSNSREIQARLCAQGTGIAVLPLPLARATPGLVQIEIPTAPPARDTWIGYHRDLRRLSRLRALVDVIVREVARL